MFLPAVMAGCVEPMVRYLNQVRLRQPHLISRLSPSGFLVAGGCPTRPLGEFRGRVQRTGVVGPISDAEYLWVGRVVSSSNTLTVVGFLRKALILSSTFLR